MVKNNTANKQEGQLNYSIAQQRQAIEHLIALYQKDILPADSTLLEPAKQGVLVLAWLERRQKLMKALDRLERERPELVDLFAARNIVVLNAASEEPF